MNLLQNMNVAMAYIEENLTDEIDMKEVARLAYCSVIDVAMKFGYNSPTADIH